MALLPDAILNWQDGGKFIELEGCQVYTRTEGAGPWLVVLHGFPTSSWDFHRILPGLAKHFRVLLLDFPGFGLSEKPIGRDYSLKRQCDVVQAALAHLGIGQLHILAHDMGDSVAAELLYRKAEGQVRQNIHSVSLLNGGIYPELHHPLPTQRMLRTPILGKITAHLSTYAVFKAQYPRVYAFPEDFHEEHYREQWALMLHNGGRSVLADLAGYMRERKRYGERWWKPLEQLQVPLRLVWGAEDPIAVPAIAEQLVMRNENSRLAQLAGVGHYPQLEAPERCLEALLRGYRSARLAS